MIVCGAGQAGAGDRRVADATAPEHRDRVAAADLAGEHRRAEPGHHAAAEQPGDLRLHAAGSTFVHCPAATSVFSAKAPMPSAGRQRRRRRAVIFCVALWVAKQYQGRPRRHDAALAAHGPPVEDHEVAGRHVDDVVADRLDHTGRLVPEEEREVVVDRRPRGSGGRCGTPRTPAPARGPRPAPDRAPTIVSTRDRLASLASADDASDLVRHGAGTYPRQSTVARAVDSVGRDEGAPQLHRPARRSRRSWRALEDAGHEPALVVGRADPRPVPVGRPRRVGRHASTTRCGCSASCRASGSTRWPPTPASCASSARCTTSSSATSTAPAGSRPATTRRCGRSPTSRPSSASPRRCPSTRAASACWPATTSRRAATSACRSSASASSTGTATSASRCRPTAGSRSATPTSTRTPWRSRRATASRVEVDLAGTPLVRPGVAGRRRAGCRCTCSTPTSRRTPADLRPSPTGSTAATPSTGCARRSSSASAACGRSRRSASTPRCSTPTRATPASSASSASASWSNDDGLSLPRGHRGGAGRRASSRPTRRCRPASTASPAS